MRSEFISRKTVSVVEAHHEVLEAWALTRLTLEQPPNLISLDFHTDTHEPFDYFLLTQEIGEAESELRRSHLLSLINYKQPDSVMAAIEKLRHDEHILTALDAGIISAAFVVCQNPAPFTSVFEREKTAREIRIEGLLGYGEPITRPTEKGKSVYFAEVKCPASCPKHRCDEACNADNRRQVIESHALSRYIDELAEKACAVQIPLPTKSPYILDIDLDYFSSFAAVNPNNPTTFHELIRGAVSITIAIEKGCTESLWQRGERFDIDELLEIVKSHIRTALGT